MHNGNLKLRVCSCTSLAFIVSSSRHATALQLQMEKLGDTPAAGGERNDAIEHCLAGIARLQHEVKDASSYVPAYDQRTYAGVSYTPFC